MGLTRDDAEAMARESEEMFGTYGRGGGMTTKAFALSNVVRTRLNVFEVTLAGGDGE